MSVMFGNICKLDTSGPVVNTSHNSSRQRNRTSTASGDCLHPRAKENLRVVTINCQKLKNKKAEFAATLNYMKPDLVCGTESWLRGVKPGKPPAQEAVRSSECFPPNYVAHRKDRGSLGGGVFILTKEDLVTTELTEASNMNGGEIIWAKVKTRAKHLFVGSFYMPHQEMKHLDNLDASLVS